MLPLVLAALAATGAHLLYTAVVLGQQHLSAPVVRRAAAERRGRFEDWLTQADLGDADPRQLGLLVGVLFVLGALVGGIALGGPLAALVLGLFTATFPVASAQQRARRRRAEAADAWPRMIEEIRLLCGSVGRPIPRALLEVGRRGPVELRGAFAEADREWRLSTDFARTVTVLKERLADPTADAACETLLVAHGIGGTDVDRRLAALAEDRQDDLQGRKDARAKQAGVRFARRFVLLVPIGMALAGMSIGNGKAAYATAEGQIAVAIALLTLGGCWWWAGALIRLPSEERVFRA